MSFVFESQRGSFSTFQRTRGVLRLLAEVVLDLYSRKVPSPLIQSSLVNLENQTIRREFIKHIGNEYESVIAADIAGKNAKAPKIDKQMGSEYEKFGIATGIATSIFLHSFSGKRWNVVTLPRIRVAVLREGIQPAIISDAIVKLEEELWYLHSEGKQYAFRNQPNLNRVIIQKEETISDERVRSELKNMLQRIAGRALEVYLWPEESSDIPDNKNLKLVILDPENSFDSEKVIRFTSELFDRAGSGFRVYKNTLFVIAIQSSQYASLLKVLRRYLAISEIEADNRFLETLSEESQKELRQKLEEVKKSIPFEILNAYRHIAFLGERDIVWKDLGIPTVGINLSISERVKQYLKDQEKILSRLTPKYILEKTFAQQENEKSLREIYELFLKTPGMPLLEGENVLLEAVKEGARNGIIGIKFDNEVYYRESVSPTMDSVIIRGETARVIKEAQVVSAESAKDEVKEQPLWSKVEEVKRVEGVKRLSFRAKIPWDKFSDLIMGVIRPLKDRNAELDITIEIKASSDDGFDRFTLDSKIKETLNQIRAIIEDWKEE